MKITRLSKILLESFCSKSWLKFSNILLVLNGLKLNCALKFPILSLKYNFHRACLKCFYNLFDDKALSGNSFMNSLFQVIDLQSLIQWFATK